MSTVPIQWRCSVVFEANLVISPYMFQTACSYISVSPFNSVSAAVRFTVIHFIYSANLVSTDLEIAASSSKLTSYINGTSVPESLTPQLAFITEDDDVFVPSVIIVAGLSSAGTLNLGVFTNDPFREYADDECNGGDYSITRVCRGGALREGGRYLWV